MTTTMTPTATAAPSIPASRVDPATWVDRHADGLFRYALMQVRDRHQAEDLVQETLLAALQARDQFAGRCSERTWLIGILRHKIADHFRRVSRLRPMEEGDLLCCEQEELFQTTGPWKGHWKAGKGPAAWSPDPAASFEQEEFWHVLRQCVEELPPRLARAFWLREVDEKSTEEICKDLGVTATNLWVMLHRARMQLRRSLELKWFDRGAEIA